jgi:hypothetical protein
MRDVRIGDRSTTGAVRCVRFHLSSKGVSSCPPLGNVAIAVLRNGLDLRYFFCLTLTRFFFPVSMMIHRRVGL